MMEKIRMEILAELDLLDASLEAMMLELEARDPQELNVIGQSEQWSPLEVCMHVYLSEKLSLAYVEKKLSFSPSLTKAGIVAWIRHLTLQWYLKSSFKFSAPQGTTVFGEASGLSLDKIKGDWFQERQVIRKFLNNVPGMMLDKEIYRHPIVGRLSLLQMIKFFKVHFERHLKQIKKRLN